MLNAPGLRFLLLLPFAGAWFAACSSDDAVPANPPPGGGGGAVDGSVEDDGSPPPEGGPDAPDAEEGGPELCPAGTILCEGSTKKVCDGQGGYSDVVTCEVVCSTSAGCLDCAAGDVICDGNIAKTCDGAGGFSQETDCGAGSCVATYGCAPCESTSVSCAGTQMVVCGDVVKDCAAEGKVCVAPIGCMTCAPGTGTCNGNVGTYCKANGSGFATETCDPVQGMTCNPQTGRCDGACAPQQLESSYIGCDYFPTVTANIVFSGFNFAVAISNTTASAATITVTQGPATLKTVSVGPNSVEVVTLPWVTSLKGPDAELVTGTTKPFPASIRVPQGAYRLRSTQPVTVYQFNPLEYKQGPVNLTYSYTNDASLLLPTTSWTGKYFVSAMQHFGGGSGFLAVVAKEDNTSVTLTGGPNATVKPGIPEINSTGSGTVVLAAGDVIQVVTNGGSTPTVSLESADVSGTKVVADKPVQVIGGHQCIYIPYNVAACDHIEESMFPYETLSNEYLVTAPLIPTGGATPKVEWVRIVATKDGTTLTYDPPQAGAAAAIAKAGGYIDLPNNNKDFLVTANEPVYVVQYMEGQNAGGGSGDPAMAQAVTKEQYRTKYLFHAPTNYDNNYVNIVAPVGAVVLLDGTTVPNGEFAVIGGSGYAVARKPLNNSGNGNHTVTSDLPVGISVYGYGQYTSYWYPGGSDLEKLHD